MYTDKHTNNRYTQSQINYNERKAKREFINEFMLTHGYMFCERCNTNQPPFNVSHNKSVGHCKNDSDIEMIWNKENFELLCQEKCHKIKDGLDLRFK